MNDPWEVRDLPAPPAYNFRNLIKMIGPGAVLLAGSIGGGEWLVGPAVGVRYGLQFMWLVPLAIFFQLILNLQAIRFTLYTGEPVYVGFLRQRPGRRFWLAFYGFLAFLQSGWPALASASAVALFASYWGDLPSDSNSQAIYWIATGVVLLTLLLLSFGGTIERMLERISYVMMSLVFLFLLSVNLLFVPASHWWLTFRSFFDFTAVAGEADWALLGALVASSGAGGIGNLTLTSWYRDKGMGMASLVGAIPSAIGGTELKLSPKGKVFPVTQDNLRRWAEWLRFVRADQLYLWAFFALAGMYLNVNLATAVIPVGTDLSGMATGAYQAKYLAQVLPSLWGLTLLNGFWILFSTHLADTDILVRTVSDLLWAGSERVRQRRLSGIRTVYYSILIGFTLWCFVGVRLATPLTLFKIQANVAGFILVIATFQVFLLNRKFLPRELRSRWEWVLIAGGLFFLFFAIRVVLSVTFQ